jgi:hypothetical protein
VHGSGRGISDDTLIPLALVRTLMQRRDVAAIPALRRGVQPMAGGTKESNARHIETRLWAALDQHCSGYLSVIASLSERAYHSKHAR